MPLPAPAASSQLPRRPGASRALVVLLALLALLPLLARPQSAAPANRAQGDTFDVQLLAINDFHGNLEPQDSDGQQVGGAGYLAALLDDRERLARPDVARSLRVAAGDLVGASPLVSALQRDEPTVDVLGQMGFRYTSVGNHEFDHGVAELLRLQNGGCRPSDALPSAPGALQAPPAPAPAPAAGPPPLACHPGARFQYLAANVVATATGQPILPPYVVERVNGVPIAFLGLVHKETPTIVVPSGVAGLRFLDEAETANRYVAELQALGVRAIVALIHQGGEGSRTLGPTRGAIVPIVEVMDPEVDLVVAGHTHRIHQGTIGTKLVVQQGQFGRNFSDIRLTLDRASGDVVAKRAEIVDVRADPAAGVRPEPTVQALVTRAVATAAPLAERVVGEAAEPLSRAGNAAGETALGNLIADAQRADQGTQIAFTNPGGIRTDLAAGPVTYGALFAVQPFGNNLVRLTLTGAQIERLLEQQWEGQASPRILKSSGLTYTWHRDRPAGDRVDPAEVLVGGEPLDLAASYTVAVNSFLADGGDNFTVLREGADRQGGRTDLDALVTYVESLPRPFTAAIEGRIQVRNAPAPP